MLGRLFLALALIWTPVYAQAAWLRAKSENFVVYGNMAPDKMKEFIVRIERFHALMKTRLPAAQRSDPSQLTVFVLSDEDAVQKSMGIRGTKNVAGYYNANFFGPYAVVPRTAGTGDKSDLNSWIVLYHEYAHHFMLQYFSSGYPAWFIEGFAEFYSTVDFAKDGSVGIGRPAYHRAYGLVALRPFPVTRMFARDSGKMSAEETESFYATAWLLTHYLTFAPDRKGELSAYLKAFGNGDDPDVAAKNAFGDLAALQRDLGKYLAARTMSYLSIKTFAFSEPAVAIQALTAEEAALMPLMLRFHQGSDTKKEVDLFVVDARKAAAQFPESAQALEYLAEGELDAGNFDAADKANEALLKIRPTDARSLLRTARIAAARMDKSGYTGGWPAIRKLIVKANRADPNDAFALSEYFNTFVREGVPPAAIAVNGMKRAAELAPQVQSIRFQLAHYLVEAGKKDDARMFLAPLLNDPHSAEVRAAARAILDPPTTQPDKNTDKIPS